MNSVNEAIQLIIEFSENEIPFLDILIKRGSKGIKMNLHHQPTDCQRCLSYSTSHQKHCLKITPFVMARRICTIVENNSLKNKDLSELKEIFRTYSYPEKVVEI